MTRSGLLPAGDERHLKAREAAMHAASRVGWGASTVDATLAAYHCSLADQGARFVEERALRDALIEASAKYAGTGQPGDVLLAVAMNQSLAVVDELVLRRFGGADTQKDKCPVTSDTCGRDRAVCNDVIGCQITRDRRGFVLVSDVAGWLRTAMRAQSPAVAEAFLRRFGGGDEATTSRRKEPQP